MNKKECTRLAKQKWGPGAAAQNYSSKDRHQRFGIVFFVPGGALDKPAVGCLGYGDSYQAAWEMAEKNPTAQAIETEWTRTKQDFEMFRVDPHGYLEKRKSQMLSVLTKETATQQIAVEGLGENHGK